MNHNWYYTSLGGKSIDPGTGSFGFLIDPQGYYYTNLACDATVEYAGEGIVLWATVNVLEIGTQLYTDELLTTPYSYFSDSWHSLYNGTIVEISTTGTVLDISQCTYPPSTEITLCYDNASPANACTQCGFIPTPEYYALTLDNRSIEDPQSCFWIGGGGPWTQYLLPINEIIGTNIPGVIDVNRSGIGYPKIAPSAIVTPTIDLYNLVVEVSASLLSVTRDMEYAAIFQANLYYIVAPSGSSEYRLRELAPKIQFPNSPTLKYWNSQYTPPITNAQYSVVVPKVSIGETLYVFWEVLGTNYFYERAFFNYKGFQLKLFQ